MLEQGGDVLEQGGDVLEQGGSTIEAAIRLETTGVHGAMFQSFILV